LAGLWGIRVAGGTGEVARIDDFDEREARGKGLRAILDVRSRALGRPGGVFSEDAARLAIAGRAGGASATLPGGIALGDPIEPRIAGDAGFRRTVVGAAPLEPNAFLSAGVAALPDFRRAGALTDGAPGGRAFEKRFG